MEKLSGLSYAALLCLTCTAGRLLGSVAATLLSLTYTVGSLLGDVAATCLWIALCSKLHVPNERLHEYGIPHWIIQALIYLDCFQSGGA